MVARGSRAQKTAASRAAVTHEPLLACSSRRMDTGCMDPGITLEYKDFRIRTGEGLNGAEFVRSDRRHRASPGEAATKLEENSQDRGGHRAGGRPRHRGLFR